MGGSSLTTGAGLPWGTTDNRMDLDPTHSALANGGGTPWGPGNNNGSNDWNPFHSALGTGLGTIWGPGSNGGSNNNGGTTPTGTTSPTLPKTGALPSYSSASNNMDFRNAYLKALKPNTNFNIDAQKQASTGFAKPSGGNTSGKF